MTEKIQPNPFGGISEERLEELSRWAKVRDYDVCENTMELVAEVRRLQKLWTWEESIRQDDKKDDYTKFTQELFPTRTGRHDLYARAMQLVGNRHSKAGLVALVNALLAERAPKSIESVLEAAVNWVRLHVSGIGAPNEADLEEMREWALEHGVKEK